MGTLAPVGWEDPGVETIEKVEVNRFIFAVRKHTGCYCIKVHGDMYSQGEPDVIGSWGGRAFAFEFKRGPRGMLRPMQVVKLKLWQRSFAVTGVFWRAADALAALECFPAKAEEARILDEE